MLKINAVDHIVFHVGDVDASAAWYERVLGMERRVTPSKGGEGSRTSLHFGLNKINLRPHDLLQDDWFTSRSHAAGSADLCFLTDRGPDDVAAHFKNLSIEIEAGPVIKQGARGPIRSVYVRDPDGSLIEVSSYEDR